MQHEQLPNVQQNGLSSPRGSYDSSLDQTTSPPGSYRSPEETAMRGNQSAFDSTFESVTSVHSSSSTGRSPDGSNSSPGRQAPVMSTTVGERETQEQYMSQGNASKFFYGGLLPMLGLFVKAVCSV